MLALEGCVPIVVEPDRLDILLQELRFLTRQIEVELRQKRSTAGSSLDAYVLSQSPSAYAAREYRRRRLRAHAFKCFSFDREPAWDMLLDLMATSTSDRALRVTSVCIASHTPPTTALRHLALLSEHQLVTIQDDERDGRARSVRLSAKGHAAVDRYFSLLDESGLGA